MRCVTIHNTINIIHKRLDILGKSSQCVYQRIICNIVFISKSYKTIENLSVYKDYTLNVSNVDNDIDTFLYSISLDGVTLLLGLSFNIKQAKTPSSILYQF